MTNYPFLIALILGPGAFFLNIITAVLFYSLMRWKIFFLPIQIEYVLYEFILAVFIGIHYTAVQNKAMPKSILEKTMLYYLFLTFMPKICLFVLIHFIKPAAAQGGLQFSVRYAVITLSVIAIQAIIVYFALKLSNNFASKQKKKKFKIKAENSNSQDYF